VAFLNGLVPIVFLAPWLSCLQEKYPPKRAAASAGARALQLLRDSTSTQTLTIAMAELKSRSNSSEEAGPAIDNRTRRISSSSDHYGQYTPLSRSSSASPETEGRSNPTSPADSIQPFASYGSMSGDAEDEEGGERDRNHNHNDNDDADAYYSCGEEGFDVPKSKCSIIMGQLNEIWQTVQLKAVWRPMTFVFLFNLCQVPPADAHVDAGFAALRIDAGFAALRIDAGFAALRIDAGFAALRIDELSPN
jgi:hypothetical protein